MTTTNAPNKFRYEGNGATDTFAFTGRIFSADDLVVEIILRADDTLVGTLVLTTDYTITINGPSSASVTVTAPNIPSTLQDIQLRRVLDRSQSLRLPTGTVFPAVSVETALDKATALIQDMQEELDRAVKLSPTSSIEDITFAETPEDGRAPVWSDSLSGYINGPNASEIAAADDAAATATAAAAAAVIAKDQAEAASSGLKWRGPVKAATTANITLSGAQTIDTVSCIAGDRVLVKNQSAPAQNGVYVVAAGAWTRATDADTWAELTSQTVAVEQGSANGDFTYICTSDTGGTIGVTAITWSEFKISQTGALTVGGLLTASFSAVINAFLTVYGAASFFNIVNLVTPTTSTASLNMPHGVAPSAPTNGDMWTTTAGIFARISGATKQLDVASGKFTSVNQTTGTSVANSTLTAILFDTETTDDGNWHSTSVNTSRITVDFTGKAHVAGCVSFAAGSNGRHALIIYKNGVEYTRTDLNLASSGVIQVNDIVPVTSGDYLELYAFQVMGATKTTDTAYTRFKVLQIV